MTTETINKDLSILLPKKASSGDGDGMNVWYVYDDMGHHDGGSILRYIYIAIDTSAPAEALPWAILTALLNLVARLLGPSYQYRY